MNTMRSVLTDISFIGGDHHDMTKFRLVGRII